jgi:hypothetical protein
MDVLRDPATVSILTVILIVLGVVTILVPTILFFRGRQRKNLVYKTSATPLVSVHPDAREDITILVEGHRVGRPVHLVRMELNNVGGHISELDPRDGFALGLWLKSHSARKIRS